MKFRIFGGFTEDQAEIIDGKSLKSLLCDTIVSTTSKIPSAPKGHDCSKSEKEVIEYFFSSPRLAYFKEKTSNTEEAPKCSMELFDKNPEIVDAFFDLYRTEFESPMNQENRSQADIKNRYCIHEILSIKTSLGIDRRDRVVDTRMRGHKLPKIEDYNPHHSLTKNPSTNPESIILSRVVPRHTPRR